MYKKGKNRGGLIPLPTHPKKLHKPYLIKHAGLLLGGVLMVVLAAFWSGYMLGGSDVVVVNSEQSSAQPTSTFGEVKSSLGYAFKYDNAVFKVNSGGKPIDKNESLTEVRLEPNSFVIKGPEALSLLSIKTDSDRTAFEQYKKKTRQADDNTAVVGYYAPVSDKSFIIEKLSGAEQTFDGLQLQKTVYVQKPRFSEGKEVFSVVWTGFNGGRPFNISIDNLTDQNIPAIYSQIFDTLRLGENASTEVLADTVDKEKSFDMNRVSPAVVKIYHFVCGTLVVDGVEQGGETCDGGVGSGFLVSNDGYIATSGHVVVLGAADILVNELLNNPGLLHQFTTAAGLNAAQSADNSAVASVLAKLYDLPADKLKLANKREANFVALGDRPLKASTPEDVEKILNSADSDYIKKAETIGVNFQPKDLLVIEQQDQTGFSASDVALLKINAQNTPFIRLADSSGVRQNDPLSLIGFPADAENQLTSNDTIAPSVTNGTISSIRKANGSSALLFQTDADASEGNSGGPAIDGQGAAFGLVTYRFKSDTETDAAKSYIRDIQDFKELVEAEEASLSTKSPTQSSWEQGLKLYKSDRYTKAIREFNKVKNAYPAHRLVDSYISGAQQAIRDGKDKKDPPYMLIISIISIILGILIVIVSLKIIIRHKQRHNTYKTDHEDNQKIINPEN